MSELKITDDIFFNQTDLGQDSIQRIVSDSIGHCDDCLLYTSPSPRDATLSRMPSSA